MLDWAASGVTVTVIIAGSSTESSSRFNPFDPWGSFRPMNEVNIFDAADFLHRLFAALPKAEMRGRENCPLLTTALRVQEVLTRPSELQKVAELEGTAADILDIYRVAVGFKTLYGTLEVDEKINQHPLAEEAKALFSNQIVDVRTTSFNLYNAHLLQSKGGIAVQVLAQAKKSGVKMPDLRVPATCYGESKALQSHSSEYLSQAMRDKLDDACEQIKEAQAREPLPFGIIALDVPRRIIKSDQAIF